MPVISALLTSHNRRDKTLSCLRALMAQRLPVGCELRVVMVDDGSTDGTTSAVRNAFPDVEILAGSGDLYWCGGMRRAWSHASSSDPDYYLLANDDTILDPDALITLLDLVQDPAQHVIAVGAIRDPDTGHPTYGGVDLRGNLLPVAGTPATCWTFNANSALLTRAVHRKMGIFHDAYTHAMGDYDYGIQAGRHGIRIIQSGRFVGSCARNPLANTWRDRSLPRSKRWKILNSPKGLPFREWAEYNRRNTDWLWPWRSVTPYLRVLLGL